MTGVGPLGEFLRRCRLAALLSQEELAERSGVKASTISDIERGVSRSPRPGTLRKLADAMNLSDEARAELLAAGRRPPAAAEGEPDQASPVVADEIGPVTLAATLTRRMERAGLSAAELAKASGVNPRTIRNVQKGRTKHIQAETARRLADALMLAGAERAAFLALAVGGSLPMAGISAPMPPAGLHGRVHEYERLLGLVREQRLITITGPGGIGKTALASAVSGRSGLPVRPYEFAGLLPGTDAIAGLVRLAGLDEGPEDDVLGPFAAGLPEDCLLVLDNLEHLAAADEAVAALLAKRADICVLATSRTPLEIPDEHEFPLDVLDPDAARTLFAAVMERVSGPPTEATRTGVIGRVCARLDCLPLAIELAAAWTSVLTPDDILAQLEHPDRVLRQRGSGPGRQASLASTVDWSLRLLPEDAVRLFCELSVYPAPWPLHLVEAVHPGPAVLDDLLQLGASGLLQADTQGPLARFGMLQTVRDVGRRLAELEPDLTARIEARHAEHLIGRAGELARLLTGADTASAMRQIGADDSHYEYALAHLVRSADRRALELAAALWRYWQYSGRYRAGLAMVRAALATTTVTVTATVADGYYGAGVLGHMAGENEAAAADAEVALGLYRELGDAAGMGAVMSLNGMICLYAGQIDEAVRWYKTGLEVATWEAAPRSHATLLSNFAPLRARQGNLAEASRLAEEAAIRYRLLADMRGVAAQLGNLAGWSAQLGDVERARDLINETRQIFEELTDPSGLREVYLQLTEHALNEGDLQAADEALALADQYGAELEDPWGDSLAASFAAELLLLRGDLAAAVRDAKVAAARAEQITWQHAIIRAYFVQAVGLARLGRAGEARRAARSGLKLCTAEDAAAITSLSSVVSVLAVGPEAGRLAQAAAAAAQVPGAAPYAAVGPLGRAAGTGPVEPVDLMSVRELAIELCRPA